MVTCWSMKNESAWLSTWWIDHLMDSQAIDYKEALSGRQPNFFLFLFYLFILCESFMGSSFFMIILEFLNSLIFFFLNSLIDSVLCLEYVSFL